MKPIMLGAAIALAFTFSSCEKEKETLNNVDRTFMTSIAYANLGEIAMGKLASGKGTDPKIKAYGQKMVDEHTAAHNELKSLASETEFILPNSTDSEHQSLIQSLNGLSGRAFDSLYIHSQVAGHEKVVTQFNTEIAGGEHESVRNYASARLPKIEQHLEEAKSLRNDF